jgi:hypothetical protein
MAVSSVLCLLVCLPLDARSRIQTPQKRWFFKSDKNMQHTFLRIRIKPEAPCHMILLHAKYHFQVRAEILRKAKLSFLSSISAACYHMSLLVGLPGSCGEPFRTFPLSTLSFHHGSPCWYIIWGMNNSPVGGRSSETQSHPIDMITLNDPVT